MDMTSVAVVAEGKETGAPSPAPSAGPPPEVLDATRALLWITSAVDAAAIALSLVLALGGTTVPATGSSGDAIPVDISFGIGQPVLPSAPRASPARLLLERYLPGFVTDAYRAVELGEQTSRLAEDAAIDPLTRLANRRMLGRCLGRLRPEDTVIMIDLDHFKEINDTFGHSEGDRVLRAMGQTLAGTVRAAERAGRYGGEEFVVILGQGDPEAFLVRLRAEWVKTRPHPVTFSAGIASARPEPRQALQAADRAMYRAKASGRDRWDTATKDDYL